MNTWQATLIVPTAAARAGDFSNAGTPVLNFSSNTPFPGSIVPLSRLAPQAVSATAAMPMPNGGFGQSPNATFTASDALPSGGHFTVGANSLSQLSNFGGFSQIQRTFPFNQTITFQLFVDGLLIASKDVTYTTI